MQKIYILFFLHAQCGHNKKCLESELEKYFKDARKDMYDSTSDEPFKEDWEMII